MAKNKKSKIKKRSIQQAVRPKREGFFNFLSGVKVELTKRVIWPGPTQLRNYSIIVFSFVIFWAIYIGIWDFLFAKGMEAIVSK